jgi:predicted metalloprotease with PDZ domain
MRRFILAIMLLVLSGTGVMAQSNTYRYELDLTKVHNDQLTVELNTPDIESKTVRFYMPNIIPGTYMESNYGRFVTNLKAYNKRGRELPVEKVDTNTWEIKKAHKMVRLSYDVEDTYDTEVASGVYGMSGTNIEEGKNFVIHTPGFFGYFDEMKEQPFEVSITKPENFYGSTGLIPASTSATKDLYRTGDYDLLMDSPIMYNEPDITTIDVANAEVLISVYSPTGKVTSSFLAGRFKKLLEAHADYLGGKLPVEKYAFIMYFADMGSIQSGTGALEHNYSSFYYLGERPQEQFASMLVDIASHEFYHIMTPLNIHSEEIAYFNYKKADLSKHLWLYEGVTEYSAHHSQVRNGLNTTDEFLGKLAEKINTSKENYDDNLPFTELSEFAAGKYAREYANVYQKGALIGAMLDIGIIDATDADMDLQMLIHKLSKKYGEDHPFKDDELFDVIADMTAPEIRDFFKRYVEGTESLPYKDFFAKAGVIFEQEPDQQVASLGNIQLGYNQKGNLLMVRDTAGMNTFGKNIGYQPGDLLYKLQGQEIDPLKARDLLDTYSKNTEEGESVEIVVKRADEDGNWKDVALSAPAFMVTKKGKYTLRMDENASYEQRRIRNKWLTGSSVTARMADVESIDSIINAMYDVISGPAGKRDWDRNASLFHPDARMFAVAHKQDGSSQLVSMTNADYKKRNDPFFMKSGFWEEEIGRQVYRFGDMATVLTAYQFKTEKDGDIRQRGVNSVQLMHDQGRWWITNISWNSEHEGNAIPEGWINKQDTETAAAN